MGHEQSPCRQQVRVCYVFDVREVEKVRVRPNLHLVFAFAVDVHRVVDQLYIAFAEDA